MFRIADPDTAYPTPVTITVPGVDGTDVTATMSIHFRVLAADEFTRLARRSDSEVLVAAIRGWDDVQDEHGEALAYSPEACQRLAQIPYVARGAVDAYVDRFVDARKKLQAAARHLTGSGTTHAADEVADDAAAFGLAPPAPEPDPECLILPENADIVRLFAATLTQWRYGPSGHATGLDYAACRASAVALGVSWRETFDGVRVMEAEALRVLGIEAARATAAADSRRPRSG